MILVGLLPTPSFEPCGHLRHGERLAPGSPVKVGGDGVESGLVFRLFTFQKQDAVLDGRTHGSEASALDQRFDERMALIGQ